MVIDLKPVFLSNDGCLPLDVTVDLHDLSMYGSHPFASPVRCTGKIEMRTGVVHLDAALEGVYDAPCDRCGEPAARAFRVTVCRVLVRELENEEDDHLLAVPDMRLDLDQLVTEEVVLSQPAKHLCKDACRGICPMCGKNRNQTDCGCRSSSGDERLKSLEALLRTPDSTEH